MNRAAYIDPTVRSFGDVRLGEGSSLWPYAVLRAERNHIAVGAYSNLQDHVIVHIGWDQPTIIGNYCTIGHRATIHGCTIEEGCLIGLGASILDGCTVGRGSVLGGHSFLPPGTIVPPNSLVMGTPGRVVRTIDKLRDNVADALLYHENALAYAGGAHRSWVDADLDRLKARAADILARAGCASATLD